MNVYILKVSYINNICIRVYVIYIVNRFLVNLLIFFKFLGFVSF